jgi:hypothetical protein
MQQITTDEYNNSIEFRIINNIVYIDKISMNKNNQQNHIEYFIFFLKNHFINLQNNGIIKYRQLVSDYDWCAIQHSKWTIVTNTDGGKIIECDIYNAFELIVFCHIDIHSYNLLFNMLNYEDE